MLLINPPNRGQFRCPRLSGVLPRKGRRVITNITNYPYPGKARKPRIPGPPSPSVLKSLNGFCVLSLREKTSSAVESVGDAACWRRKFSTRSIYHTEDSKKTNGGWESYDDFRTYHDYDYFYLLCNSSSGYRFVQLGPRRLPEIKNRIKTLCQTLYRSTLARKGRLHIMHVVH